MPSFRPGWWLCLVRLWNFGIGKLVGRDRSLGASLAGYLYFVFEVCFCASWFSCHVRGSTTHPPCCGQSHWCSHVFPAVMHWTIWNWKPEDLIPPGSRFGQIVGPQGCKSNQCKVCNHLIRDKSKSRDQAILVNETLRSRQKAGEGPKQNGRWGGAWSRKACVNTASHRS